MATISSGAYGKVYQVVKEQHVNADQVDGHQQTCYAMKVMSKSKVKQ